MVMGGLSKRELFVAKFAAIFSLGLSATYMFVLFCFLTIIINIIVRLATRGLKFETISRKTENMKRKPRKTSLRTLSSRGVLLLRFYRADACGSF